MLQALIEPYINAFSGQVALAFYDFRSGASFLHRATQTMRSASLIKLPLLIQALSEVQLGRLELSQRYKLAAAECVGGAGILQTLEPGLELTLHDLLTLMIIISDNTATNKVIDILGEAAANAFLRELGLSQTRLVGKLQLPAAKQNEAQKRGERNSSCAADMLALLLRLEQRDLLSEGLTQLALNILKKQQFTEALSRYLPRDAELYDEPLTVASKSGCLRGLWHDAGIIYDAAGRALYALVIMTEGSRDESYSWEQEGMMLIARLSELIYKQVR